MQKTSILITATIAAITAGGFAIAQQSAMNTPVAIQASSDGAKPDAPREGHMECDRRGGRDGKHRHTHRHRAGKDAPTPPVVQPDGPVAPVQNTSDGVGL